MRAPTVIQALDLVGRKLALNGGRAVMAAFTEIGDFCEENVQTSRWRRSPKALKKGLNDLQASTMWFMQNAMAKPDNAGAGSTDYMHLFGLVMLGFMWAKMAKSAQELLAVGDERTDFLKTSLSRRASTWTRSCRKRRCEKSVSRRAATR